MVQVSLQWFGQPSQAVAGTSEDARTLEVPEVQMHKTVTASELDFKMHHIASLGPENSLQISEQCLGSFFGHNHLI